MDATLRGTTASTFAMTHSTDNMLAPLSHALRATHKDKIVSAADAVQLVHD